MKTVLTLLCCVLAAHTYAQSTDFYVQPEGSNLNAGSTTNDTAVLTYASGSWVAATGVFTPASGSPLADGVSVGHWASVYPDGTTTNTHLVGQVIAVDETTITVSLAQKSGRAPEDGAGNRTLKIGGAWQGPTNSVSFPFNFVEARMVNSVPGVNKTNITRVLFKGGGSDYLPTNLMVHGNNGPMIFEGYTNTPGDGGMARIFGSTNHLPYTVFSNTADGIIFRNIWWDRNGLGPIGTRTGQEIVCNLGVGTTWYRNRWSNSWRTGLRQSGAGSVFIECEADRCNIDEGNLMAGFLVLEESTWIRCWSHDSMFGPDCVGFNFDNGGNEPVVLINCVAERNVTGFWTSGAEANVTFIGCTAISNTVSGFDFFGLSADALAPIVMESCHIISNTWGIYGYGFQQAPLIVNCGFQGNVNDYTNINPAFVSGSVHYNASPFVDAGRGDLSLNNLPGAGAAARNAGRGAFLQSSNFSARTVSYPDIGTVQMANAGGGTVPGDSNGDGVVDQGELNVVLTNYWANNPGLSMTNPASSGGVIQFALTNALNWNFSVLVSSNLVDWELLPAAAMPVYQFFDPQATNAPQRYYRLQYP